MLPFTLEELQQEIDAGNIIARRHPIYPYTVYSYGQNVQYERNWNEVTSTCRGLILDDEGNIIARPFKKFFNYTEFVPDPIIYGRPCTAFEKADGSLGIIFPNPSNQGYGIATRGSFASDQAIWASTWLSANMPDFSQPEGVTTLCEIIYPENRIVVDYKGFEGLVLLGAIDNTTGADIPHWEIDWWDGEKTKIYHDINTADEGYHLANTTDFDSREGLVLTWYKHNQSSFRLKTKNFEYIRLHSIITNFSPKKVWQALMDDTDFLQLLDTVPDEFYELVHQIQTDLTVAYAEVEARAKSDFHDLREFKTNRKKFAQEAVKKDNKSILFAMLDGKDYSKMIWKQLEPKEQNENQ